MAEKTAFKIISKTLRQVINRSSSTLSHAMTSDLAVPGSTVRSFDEIPGPTGIHRWPVIGTLLNFQPFTEFTAENTYQLLRSMYLQYGPIFRLKLGEDTVVLTDPEDVGTVYANEGRCPLRPNLSLRDAYARRNGLTLRDVSTLQGEEWQALRSPLNKLLVRVNAATHYLPAQSQVADDLVSSLAREHLTAEKISELLFRFSAESIGVVCFNSRLGLLQNINEDNAEIQQFLQAAKDNFTALHDSLTGKSLAHTLYRNTTYTQYQNSMIVLSQYSRKLITQARQKLDQHRNEQSFNPEKHNLLNSLLSDKSLDDESVSQILESLFIGGTDSTAGSIAALFYNLARNPDKQDKLAAEVKQCTGSASEVTPEMISRMHYLKACVKESFRLHYPASTVFRVLSKDIVVSGYHVPAGVQIFLMNALTCEHHFENPRQYLPERWMRSFEGHLGDSIPKNAVLPFSMGPRNCIGRRFAEQEIYLSAIKVLQKLKIGIADESRDVKFVYRIFLQPEQPIQFTFTKRSEGM